MPAPIEAWDASVLLWVQENLRTAFGNVIIPFWSHLGDHGLLWIAAALLLLCFRKTRRAGALALGGLFFSLLAVNGAIKHLVGRPRPWLAIEGLSVLVNEPDPNSFPSGHTSAAFAFAVAVYRELPIPWTRFAVLGAAICMGWSRIYVAVHYPSDVIAGAIVGGLCGWLAAWLYRCVLREHFPLDGSRAGQER